MISSCGEPPIAFTATDPVALSGDEHPTATSHGSDPIVPDPTPDPDNEGIATAGAQIGQAGPTRQFLAAEHATGVLGKHLEHGPLLSGETLKGVRALD